MFSAANVFQYAGLVPRGGCTGEKEWSRVAVSETCLVAGQGQHAAMHIETGAVQLERCWAGQGTTLQSCASISSAHQAEQARLHPTLGTCKRARKQPCCKPTQLRPKLAIILSGPMLSSTPDGTGPCAPSPRQVLQTCMQQALLPCPQPSAPQQQEQPCVRPAPRQECTESRCPIYTFPIDAASA